MNSNGKSWPNRGEKRSEKMRNTLSSRGFPPAAPCNTSAEDRKSQAILTPIPWKNPECWNKATIDDKVLANAEIKTMINAFGCGFSEGYGNDFDITKLRV